MTTDQDVLTKLDEVGDNLGAIENLLERMEGASKQDEAWRKQALK